MEVIVIIPFVAVVAEVRLVEESVREIASVRHGSLYPTTQTLARGWNLILPSKSTAITRP